MKKLLTVGLFIILSLELFAQKDTLFFLYKGNLYGKQSASECPLLKKRVDENKNVFFTLKGKDSVEHEFAYFPRYDKEKLFEILRVLTSPKVFFIGSLSDLNEHDFIRKFGYIGYENREVIIYLVPLLDAGKASFSAYEISFFSDFLLNDE